MDNPLSTLLKNSRLARKLSQVAMAELIGMSPSAYSRTERGEPVHNATDLINMSQKLQIPIQHLLPEAFSGDSNSPPNRPVPTGIALATAPGDNKHYNSLAEAAKELEARLKNLEAENAELKRKLAAR